MIQIPEHVLAELLAAMDDAIDSLSKACPDCDADGEFSFARGRLYSIKQVVENTAKQVPSQ